MIDGLRPYPEMKSTGVQWLGDVPAHWDVRRIKTLLKEIDHRTKSGEERLLSLRMRRGLVDHHDSGGKPIPPDALVGFKVIEPGQIVMNRMRAAYGLFGLADVCGLVSPDYAVFQPADNSYNRYLLETFKLPSLAAVFRAESKGLGTGESGFLRLYTDRFGPIPVSYPPLDEQRLIVRFLDWHGAQTAKLVRAKKKIIALLNEQKQAIIHRAVTCGLDPNPKLKPSGIPWLGDVPEGWEVKRLKQVSRIRYGLGQPPAEKVGGLPLIRATNVDHGRILAKHLVYVDPDAVPKSRGAFLKTGEIIVVRSGAYTADSAIIPADYEGSVAGYDIVVTATRVLPEFLAAVLLAPHVQIDQLIPASMRAAQPHLNAEELGAAVLAVPDAQSQRRIVAHIDNETAIASKAIDIAQREIALIQEFRTRLIADVVTGKLDVCAAAASLPEVTEIEPADDLAEVDDLDEVPNDAENEEVAA
ncbi:restriction endonuclease subunit S [Lichenifustis flavocetrariae]|uniref:Restriction endonuclease subunit S n=1 Tax=Lichenifustis flavocetrariae TaxID=2949735 RepID=A0AA41YZ17_9HYPH|nr:restriction endonuclease subunit S [Lichenifustis flavocetrariae]MCW6509847.1 restriction endonuclease subunit S [Lichenifustis flavocetrariae]